MIGDEDVIPRSNVKTVSVCDMVSIPSQAVFVPGSSIVRPVGPQTADEGDAETDTEITLVRRPRCPPFAFAIAAKKVSIEIVAVCSMKA